MILGYSFLNYCGEVKYRYLILISRSSSVKLGNLFHCFSLYRHFYMSIKWNKHNSWRIYFFLFSYIELLKLLIFSDSFINTLLIFLKISKVTSNTTLLHFLTSFYRTCPTYNSFIIIHSRKTYFFLKSPYSTRLIIISFTYSGLYPKPYITTHWSFSNPESSSNFTLSKLQLFELT